MSGSVDRVAMRRFLARGTWFGSMPATLQGALVDAGQRRRFRAGQMLYGRGEPPPGFWMLLQGQVMVSDNSADGDCFLFHVGGPGHCFGAAAAITGTPTSAEVTAATPVQALLIPTDVLELLLERTPAFHRHFEDLVVRRYRATMRFFAQGRTLSPVSYLRLRLEQLAALWREDGFDGPTVELALSQSDVARLLGVSRQTVNRYLSRLERDGLVEIGFRSIRILEPESAGCPASSGGAG